MNCGFWLSFCILPIGADISAAIDKGTVPFHPLGDQQNIPERYRLAEHSFDYDITRIKELPVNGIDIWAVRFVSPVQSATRENNTVYAEYYRPRGDGPFPCVIVLDITAGDQSLSRMIAR